LRKLWLTLKVTVTAFHEKRTEMFTEENVGLGSRDLDLAIEPEMSL